MFISCIFIILEGGGALEMRESVRYDEKMRKNFEFIRRELFRVKLEKIDYINVCLFQSYNSKLSQKFINKFIEIKLTRKLKSDKFRSV